jgi:hypothetical protein
MTRGVLATAVKRILVVGAATCAASAVAAPPAPADHGAEVERALFELCPKVLEGSLSLDDNAAVAALGYEPTAPRIVPAGPTPRARHGSGPTAIVISGAADAAGRGTCGVWFGGPDNDAVATRLRLAVHKAGFQGGDRPMKLGDGTDIYNYRSKDRPARSVVFIAGPAGDGIGYPPETTAVMMDTKAE